MAQFKWFIRVLASIKSNRGMNTSKVKKAERYIGIGLVLLASICWSTSSTLINLIVKRSGVSALSLAFWRDLFTSLTLLVITLPSRKKLLKINKTDVPWFILMGSISIGLFHVLWNTSVVVFGASIATVLQSNAPIFVVVLAWLIYKEPLTTKKIIAVAFSVIGTILCAGIIGSSNSQITLPMILIGISSAFTYATFPLLGRKLAGDYHPLTIMFYIFIFATITLLPFQFTSPVLGPVDAQVILYFILLVIISTIGGFGIFTAALRRIPASVASITATSEIVFATVIAFLVLHERLQTSNYLGILFVISGVVLVSLPNTPSKTDHIPD